MRRAAVVAVVAAALAIGADLPVGGKAPAPKDVGLIEHASSRLAQLDVTVTGPADAIRGLTADDFELKLNDRAVTNLIVDPLCGGLRRPATATSATSRAPASAGSTPAAHPVATTFLLYFDQAHLTQAGRMDAIQDAREMLPRLMAGGNRAMLVSSARELKTLVPLTTDPAKLEAALAAMENDVNDFDPYATAEVNRLAKVVGELKVSTERAISVARQYAREERSRQERELTRLRMVLGRLDDVEPPKVVLYFADTMRQNPGEHYLAFFSSSTLKGPNGDPTAGAADVQLASSTGATVLDRVINEASGNGIRFYTVEAQGLTSPTTVLQAQGSPFDNGNHPGPDLNHQRIRDAQGTLVSMAAETGGEAFLNGVTPAKMASRILDDLSCVYLLSFDPKGWPVDRPLAVSVRVKRPKVKTLARGRFVIESDSRRLTARLLGAYASPEATKSPVDLRVGITPIGWLDGRFQARVQVSVPPSAIPGTTWDLGASLVSRGSVDQEGSGRVSVANARVPVVWEKDMEFYPGDYELVAVAHENATDTVASKDVRGHWPNIDADVATIGPITVSQPARGGFLRNGKAATRGALVVPPDKPLAFGEPTAVISLVCRARHEKKPLHVVRTLIGESETPVGTTDVEMGPDRCVQIVDLINPKTLGTGSYEYVVAVSRGGQEITRSTAKMFVPDEGTTSPAAPAAGPGRP